MSAYFATLTDLERYAVMAGLLVGIGLLTVVIPLSWIAVIML